MDAAVGEGRVDQDGKVAPVHAEFGNVAGDVFFIHLLRQQAHVSHPGIKNAQGIRVNHRPLIAQLAKPGFHLPGPLPVEHAEADAVGITEKAFLR